MSRKLSELYQAYKDENPDLLLKRIHSFVEEAGQRYACGLMSEDEFYVATSFDMLYIDLWKMKNHIVFSQRELEEEYPAFCLSWDEWKKTGAVTTKKWMFLCISQSGNMIESVEWFFKVIDALKIPLVYFQPVAQFFPLKTVYPNVVYVVSQSNNTIRTMMADQCMNMITLLNEPDPVGKTFILWYEHGSTVEVMIEKIFKDKFWGTGTVSGYMSTPGQIEIEQIDGNWRCLFNKIQCDPLSIGIGAVPLTLPDPIWKEYNVAQMIKTMRYATEYRILRIPYMMGCATHDPKHEQKGTNYQNGKIIDFKQQFSNH